MSSFDFSILEMAKKCSGLHCEASTSLCKRKGFTKSKFLMALRKPEGGSPVMVSGGGHASR
jgi:hypothetical protein